MRIVNMGWLNDSAAGEQVELPDMTPPGGGDYYWPAPVTPQPPPQTTIKFDPATKKAILASLTMVALYAMFKAR
jgi:hypothetical protein